MTYSQVVKAFESKAKESLVQIQLLVECFLYPSSPREISHCLKGLVFYNYILKLEKDAEPFGNAGVRLLNFVT